jgi:sporulation protein YlmC with PRC-barrel domain
MRLRPIITLAGRVNVLAILCLAALSASGKTNDVTFPPPARANAVIGMTVQNNDGKALGTVRSLVFDMPSARVRYAIVSSGGFLGIRSHLRAVPAEHLSAATAVRGIVGLDLTEARWRLAPEFAASDLALLAQPARARELDAFYADSGHYVANGPGEKRADKAAADQTMSPTGRRSDRTAGPETKHELRLIFAHDLIGRTVVTGNQEKIGEIQDLLFDFDSQAPALALISTGRSFKGKSTYAASLRALSAGADKKVRWAIERNALSSAPPFDRQRWAQGVSEAYRYSAGD